MAKELMGAVIKLNNIQATYRVTVLGEASVKTKDKDYDQPTLDAANALVKLCDDLTPEVGDVIGVQLYTPITDPQGGGVCVDLLFKDNTMHRVENPPESIADARDALKEAISATL